MVWVSPKLYMLEYATSVNGETVVKTKFAGKGLNADDLTVDAFEAMDAGGSMSQQRSSR